MRTRFFLLAFASLLILPLAACRGVQSEPRTISVAGDAEVSISPDRVILAESMPRQRSIDTTGDAEVRVVPDEVILTLGVETSDKDLRTAKRSNDAIVQKVVALAQGYGIDPKHIQTDYIGIEPRYHDSYEQSEFIGYFVHKTVVITLRDVDKFEGLLGDCLEAGANYVQGIEFRTTELRKYRDQARAMAIQAAREKAQALAAELGQQIGQPLTIREDQSGWWSSYSSWWGSRYGGVAQNVSQNVGVGYLSPEGTLAPGQISVQARVSVGFELK